MSVTSFLHPTSARIGNDRETALDALLGRMRQRLYPESLPALAWCWVKSLCASKHNRAWWTQMRIGMERALREQPLERFSRAVLISVRDWIERAVLASAEAPPARQPLAPPYRPVPAEFLVPYVCRLLNEWLPAEVAFLLAKQEDAGGFDDGIPALARAKALDRLLSRERLSPETLDTFLACESLSPKLIYAADAEIFRDVVLAVLGRLHAPAPARLPAVLLGVTGDSVLPRDYEAAVCNAFIGWAENGDEQLYVPIADFTALEILRHEVVRVGSVLVTMDGRAWQPRTVLGGCGNFIVYRPGERLLIDFTADHAKLTVQWPETVVSWSGGLPRRGPFALFGREWETASWEIDGNITLLHLTFSRVIASTESSGHRCGPRPRATGIYRYGMA